MAREKKLKLVEGRGRSGLGYGCESERSHTRKIGKELLIGAGKWRRGSMWCVMGIKKADTSNTLKG